MLIHTVFECFTAINENYGHFVIELHSQLMIGIDIQFTPLKVSVAFRLCNDLLDHVTEMTSFARKNHHVMHNAIVDVRREAPGLP